MGDAQTHDEQLAAAFLRGYQFGARLERYRTKGELTYSTEDHSDTCALLAQISRGELTLMDSFAETSEGLKALGLNIPDAGLAALAKQLAEQRAKECEDAQAILSAYPADMFEAGESETN